MATANEESRHVLHYTTEANTWLMDSPLLYHDTSSQQNKNNSCSTITIRPSLGKRRRGWTTNDGNRTRFIVVLVSMFSVGFPCICHALTVRPASYVPIRNHLSLQQQQQLQQQALHASNSNSNNNNNYNSSTHLHDVSRGGGSDIRDTTKSISNSKSKSSRMLQTIARQYQSRIAADPKFFQKSIAEVILAAGTQLFAEYNRRGSQRILPELDFVIAGLLTAVAGKYYSMWRVAPTASTSSTHHNDKDKDKNRKDDNCNVPTNAFQATLPNGTTPTLSNRLLAFILPIPSLFRAGVIASGIGYGLTSLLVTLRSLIFPTYVPATIPVNVLHACLYTGAFMAVVSNIRYQVLQGVVEPVLIGGLLGRKRGRGWEGVKNGVIVGVRLANGIWGSCLAIAGMKAFGLQRLK